MFSLLMNLFSAGYFAVKTTNENKNKRENMSHIYIDELTDLHACFKSVHNKAKLLFSFRFYNKDIYGFK